MWARDTGRRSRATNASLPRMLHNGSRHPLTGAQRPCTACSPFNHPPPAPTHPPCRSKGRSTPAAAPPPATPAPPPSAAACPGCPGLARRPGPAPGSACQPVPPAGRPSAAAPPARGSAERRTGVGQMLRWTATAHMLRAVVKPTSSLGVATQAPRRASPPPPGWHETPTPTPPASSSPPRSQPRVAPWPALGCREAQRGQHGSGLRCRMRKNRPKGQPSERPTAAHTPATLHTWQLGALQADERANLRPSGGSHLQHQVLADQQHAALLPTVGAAAAQFHAVFDCSGQQGNEKRLERHAKRRRLQRWRRRRRRWTRA